jgi:hypothetical protein
LAATVVAGLLGVGAGLATAVGGRTTGAGAGAVRTTGAGAGRTTGAGAGAARTTGAGAGAELVVFLVSAKAGCDNASAASTMPAGTILLIDVMTFPQRLRRQKPRQLVNRIVLAQVFEVAPQL